MAKQKEKQGSQMTAGEKLGLRISSMINHPTAQSRRWVTIHQLDTDPQAEWEEMLDLLASTDGLEMTFNDDETVTIRWELMTDDNEVVGHADVEELGEMAF